MMIKIISLLNISKLENTLEFFLIQYNFSLFSNELIFVPSRLLIFIQVKYLFLAFCCCHVKFTKWLSQLLNEKFINSKFFFLFFFLMHLSYNCCFCWDCCVCFCNLAVDTINVHIYKFICKLLTRAKLKHLPSWTIKQTTNI